MPGLCHYHLTTMSDYSRSVYSTDAGRLCSGCKRPVAACQCQAQQQQQVKGDGVIRIHRETKGRGGKGVTLVKGLALAETELKAMAAKMKQHCGTGGTVKDGVIEIQGDNRDKLLAWLVAQGHKAKMAGG
jgi:translation initiation factor 1